MDQQTETMGMTTGVWQPQAQAYEKVQGRAATLFALFVMGFGTFVNLYATQPLLPWFREVFGASELMVSLTVSAPVLAVAIAAPFVGIFADRVGRKRVIVAAMIGLSIPTTLVATASNLEQMIFWRFLQGFFIPGIIAVGMAYISEETSHRSAGSTMATYVSGTVVGGFFGRFLTGFIAHHSGWRLGFALLGLVTLICAVLTLWLLPRSTKFMRQSGRNGMFKSIGQHLKNPQLLATYALGFNVLFALVGAFTYVNFYLADKPFNLGPSALAMIFAVYLIGAAITPFSGKMIDRIGNRRAVVIASGAAAAGILLTLVHHIPTVILGLAIGASGAFACQASASGYVGKAAGKARSAAAGLYVALYYFGGCMGSTLPGFFWKRAGWTGCVFLIVCMQAISAGIAYKLWRDPVK